MPCTRPRWNASPKARPGSLRVRGQAIAGGHQRPHRGGAVRTGGQNAAGQSLRRSHAGQIAQVERLTGHPVKRAYVDRGYGVTSWRPGPGLCRARARDRLPHDRRELRRRNAIEPVIGHLKCDGLVGAITLGAHGDARMPFWSPPATTCGCLSPGSGLCAPFSGRLSWSGMTRAAPPPHPPEHANSLFHRRPAMCTEEKGRCQGDNQNTEHRTSSFS